MATIASAKPTCASWGVSMQSPIDHTRCSPVRHSSSTTTKPRSSICTPVPSRPRSAVAGLRPTDTTTTSVLIGSPPSTFTTVPPSDRLVAGDLDACPDLHPPLLERPLDDLRRVLVDAGQDLRQDLEHGHLAAHVGQHRGELATDRPAADDDGGSRHLRYRQQLVGRHDDLAVDVEAGDGADLRPGGDDHGVTGDLDVARSLGRSGRVTRLASGDRDPSTLVEPPVAVVDRDLPTLEQRRHAAHELVDDRLLALHRDRPVDLGLTGVDAERGRFADGSVDVRGLEQLLCGDAADVEAGATDPALLDQGHVEPGAGAVERRCVAAGTAANDDDIEMIGRGNHLQDRVVGRTP